MHSSDILDLMTQKRIATTEEATAIAVAAQVNVATVFKYCAGIRLRPVCAAAIERALVEAGYAPVEPVQP